MTEKNEKMNGSGFWIRFMSAALCTILALLTIIPGGYLLATVNGLIALVGMMEIMRIVGVHKTSIAFFSYVAVIAEYILIVLDKKYLLVALFMLFLLLLFAEMVLKYPKYSSDKIFLTFGGLIYVGLGLSFLYQTRMQLDDGAYIVWLIFIGSWISDTGAYCVGVLCGKHKAFPKLSPKKSIEGCIGGILLSVLFGIGYNLVLHYFFSVDFLHIWQIAIICGVASIISQVGDLAASAVKRNYDVKDYGKLIPGHGGILDRFDSIIFVAPLVYYLAKLFQVVGISL